MNEPQPVGARPTRDPNRPPVAKSPLADQVRSLRLPPPEAPRGGGGKFAWLLCLAFAASSLWLYWQWQTARKALADAGASPATNPGDPSSSDSSASTSTTPAPNARAGDIALENRGYVTPAHQVLVSPQVSGRIMKLNLEEGRRVAKGEVLAEIDRTEYEADLARAKATLALAEQHLLELERGNRPEEIEQARAELEEFIAQVSQLEVEYGRNAQLVKTKVVSPQEFEISESKYRAMQRRVEKMRYAFKLMEEGPRVERIDSARAEVEQARAELKKAQWRLDNCTVVAPISGTILKKNAEEGNLINPIAFNGSFSFCELADLSDLEISLDIQERDIAQVFQGQACRVRPAEAYPDRVYDGVVSRLMPIADRAKGSIQVRVRVRVPSDEEGIYLKPEMSAKVSFLQPKEKSEAANKPTASEAATGDPTTSDPTTSDPPTVPAPAVPTPTSDPAASPERPAGESP